MPSFDFVINYLDSLSYVGIFFVFLISFLPMPEEILLLGIGYIIDLGDLNLYAAIFVSIAGIMVSDNMWYWLGRGHSKFASKLRKKIGEGRIIVYENLLKKHTWKYVFLFRLVPGLRAVGPAFAGWGNLNVKKFWFYDTLAVVFYAPLLVLVGYYFNFHLEIIRSRIISAKHIIFILFISVVGFGTAYFIKKKLF